MGLSHRKNEIVREISKGVEKGFVEEENLERFEILEVIMREEGSQVPESLIEAYRRVAMECTVRCLLCGEGKKKIFREAIRRIWTGRIMALCAEGSSRLVTRELRDDCRRLKLALADENACGTLIEYNAENKALVSLKKFVSELLREIVPANMESHDEGEEETDDNMSSTSEDEDKGKEIVLVNELPQLVPDHEQFSSPVKVSDGGELDQKDPLPSTKTISTPIFDRVLKELKASKQDMVNAMELAEASGSDDANKKQNIVTGNPTSQENAPKPTLMARSDTAQTYEWEDSIDDSAGESNGAGDKARSSKHRKIIVSPLKKGGASKRFKRERIPWTTAETQAILKGYEIHGPNWKVIKEENPILAHRTNVNIKDKFRVEQRRMEACGLLAQEQE